MTMSRRTSIGWFSKVVNIVVLIIASITCSRHVVCVEAEINANNNDPSFRYHHITEEIKSQWSTPDGVSANSKNPEIFHIKQLNVDSKCDIFYILVSTIDGKVSALDLHKKGSLVWSIQADARPLYSSSLASMEMTHNGKKMRIIPSLDGALYQFDGEKVEAVPLSAESLLSSTHRLSDDSMIVGSKDMRNFGVDLHTGSEGCSNSQGKPKDEPFKEDNFLILTRSTQVVRSVDIKNGNEKWNFSVGQHQIRFPPAARPSEIDDIDDEGYNVPHFTPSSDECSNKEKHKEDTCYEYLLQLLVPEGRIVALNKRDSSKVSWEFKFDSPIANAWLLHHGKLEAMNLFDGHHIPSLNTYTPEDIENENVPQPLLYIGSHQKLLYIQASPQFESVLKTITNHVIGHFIDTNIKVSWRPYLNTASVRTPIFEGNRPQIIHDRRSSDIRSRKESKSLSVWNVDYPFDTGYFLYPEFRDARSPRRKNVMLIEDFPSIYGLDKSWLQMYAWFYWKELILISFATSVFVHLFLRFFSSSQFPNTSSSDTITSNTSKSGDNSQEVMITSDSTFSHVDKMSSSGEYVSRFATDFDCLHCLGKGGFGVVFEAVNRVDDQHYAIKRIMLPKSEGAKEKVLREVKALAKLEHIGIVRYFNAWVESPPTGWQEERDKQFHISGTSGLTSYSNTVSHTGQYHPEQHLSVPNTGVREDKDRSNIDNQKMSSSSPEILVEPELKEDTFLLSSKSTLSVQLLKQSCSEEFSVQSNFSETFDRCDTDFTNSRENIFLFEDQSISETIEFSSDSNTGSKSSIPFSNYSFDSSALFSHFADNSDKDISGDSVVFESSSDKPSCNNIVCDKNIGSFEFAVSDEYLVSEDKHSKIKGQYDSQKDQDHDTADFSLLLHKNDNKGEQVKDKLSDQGSLCGAKFFLYIQMQLYRKETLKEWLNSNTLNRDRHTILDVFDQIVCAVDYVHSQGLMHRDLKPSNIFFTADGVVKVGDFGLVTALSVQQDQVCEPGERSPGRHTAEVGTTLYMSPEQIAKRPYDLKIDIFSIGLIFLELLIPFSTQMERIRTLQDAKKQVFPLRFCRELPLESELVHKMTNSDPELRPITAEILDHSLLLEFAPTRMGTRHRKRTISNNSII